MALEQDFENAVTRFKQLRRLPPVDEGVKLYGLFQQATQGDVQGKRPGVLDLLGRAKYDAWEAFKGKSKDDAKREYVALVTALVTTYGKG